MVAWPGYDCFCWNSCSLFSSVSNTTAQEETVRDGDGQTLFDCSFQFQLIFKVVAFSWVNVYAMMPNSRDFSQDQGHCYFYFILLVNADLAFFCGSSLHEYSMLETLVEDSKASMPSYPLVHGENNHFFPSHPLMSWNPLAVLSARLTQAIRVSLRVDP